MTTREYTSEVRYWRVQYARAKRSGAIDLSELCAARLTAAELDLAIALGRSN